MSRKRQHRTRRKPSTVQPRLDLASGQPRASFWTIVTGAFNHLAKWSAWAAGRPFAFVLAALVILIWLVTGPIFEFSNTWQLIINTGTTIVTFLMVFLIQNTQNRDMVALQLKLDEIIRANVGAHNAVLDLEDLSDEELERVRSQYLELAKKAHTALHKGQTDIDAPELVDLLGNDSKSKRG